MEPRRLHESAVVAVVDGARGADEAQRGTLSVKTRDELTRSRGPSGSPSKSARAAVVRLVEGVDDEG